MIDKDHIQGEAPKKIYTRIARLRGKAIQRSQLGHCDVHCQRFEVPDRSRRVTQLGDHEPRSANVGRVYVGAEPANRHHPQQRQETASRGHNRARRPLVVGGGLGDGSLACANEEFGAMKQNTATAANGALMESIGSS